MADEIQGVVSGGKETRYYTDEGRGCDHILRCKDCQRIVTTVDIHRLGSCTCGNRRFSEITLLSEQEMADIRSGVLDFPSRDKFLAEFGDGI